MRVAPHQLIHHFGHVEAVFAADTGTLQTLGVSPNVQAALHNPDWQSVEATLAWADVPGRRIVCFADADYPQLLREISDPPIVLYCEGEIALLQRQVMAIVGSRTPTPSGTETAQIFAMQLARRGFVIVSGMALGIDAAAHRGSLAAQGGTIAVVGTGLDQVYPARHAELAADIRSQGLIISEFPLGAPPLGRHFPMRNRIISGLSQGVLVVEAGIHSGSLITAHQAMEQGREVFAIPGSIHNPTSKGCHHLLREGAKLVDNINDILEELGGVLHTSTMHIAQEYPEPTENLDDQYEILLAALDDVPASVERIVERSGLTPELVCSMLLALELQNLVHITASGLYSRALGRSGNERKHPRCSDVSV